MFIKTEQEHVGTFWHPARPDEPMPGLLRVGKRGDPSVQIFGWVPEALRGVSTVRLPALLGQVRGDDVSMWDCMLSGYEGDPRSGVGNGQPSQTFEGHQLLVARRHFPDPEEACFIGVTIRPTHQAEWAAGLLDPFDRNSHYQQVARMPGARLTAWGSNVPTGGHDGMGHQSQHGVTFHLTNKARLTLHDLWFQWERPFLSYLTQAVGDEVQVLHQYATSTYDDIPAEVFTRGGLPRHTPERIPQWSLLMRLGDGRFQSRMRRWYELDRTCAHGMTNLQMFHAGSNTWTNNKLMNVAAAFDSLGAALTSLPRETEAAAKRAEVAKLITDPDLRRWFHDSTQYAGRPSYASMLAALHAPVAEATYPMIRDESVWAGRLTEARNGLAHARQDHFVTPRDFRYEHALAGVSHAVLVARLMHELGYTTAQIREHFVRMPELLHRAEQWWQVTLASEQRPG